MSLDGSKWAAYRPNLLPHLSAAEAGRGRVVFLAATDGARTEGWGPEIALGLARSWAGVGADVLLIDADPMHPSLHRVAHVENATGLSDALLFGSSVGGMAASVEDGRFRLIPAGSPLADPVSAFERPRWGELIDELAAEGLTLLVYGGTAVSWMPSLAKHATDIVLLSGPADPGGLELARDERTRAIYGLGSADDVPGDGLWADPLDALGGSPEAAVADPLAAMPSARDVGESDEDVDPLRDEPPAPDAAGESSPPSSLPVSAPAAEADPTDDIVWQEPVEPQEPEEPTDSADRRAEVSMPSVSDDPAEPATIFVPMDAFHPDESAPLPPTDPAGAGPPPDPLRDDLPSPADPVPDPGWDSVQLESTPEEEEAVFVPSTAAQDVDVGLGDAGSADGKRRRTRGSRSRGGVGRLPAAALLVVVVGAAGYVGWSRWSASSDSGSQPSATPPAAPSEAPGPATAQPEASAPAIPPAADPEALAAAAPHQRFIAAFGAFQNAETATRMRDALLGADPSGLYVVVPVTVSGNLFHRVLGGSATTGAEAEALLMELAAATGVDASTLVVRDAPMAFLMGDVDSRDLAEALVSELGEDGLPAYALSVPDPDGPGRYRVYVGAFLDTAEASTVEGLLDDLGYETTLVERRGIVLS